MIALYLEFRHPLLILEGVEVMNTRKRQAEFCFKSGIPNSIAARSAYQSLVLAQLKDRRRSKFQWRGT